MDPTTDRTARDVRLAIGGPLPADWDALTTPMLKLRWASAVGYANRTLAEPPSEAAAAAILALAEALDRRGALLHELPAGERGRRVTAAAQRLHITGTIARSVGLPVPLRQLARSDAVATVHAVWDDRLTIDDLRVEPAHGWSEQDLTGLLDAARAAREAAAAQGSSVDRADSTSDDVAPATSGNGVVDIAVPHRTARPTPGHALR